MLGLIAGHQFQDPLAEGATIVTGSTHKTFFGSQRGVILSNVDDEEWRKIDKGAFPGSSSNHHLETLVALTVCHLRDAGVRRGLRAAGRRKREAPCPQAFRRTASRSRQRSSASPRATRWPSTCRTSAAGTTAARDLKDNRIIVNMNLLPFEPLDHATSPAGIRIGVQEMTRVGMKEAEMDRIAELFKRCLMEKKFVGDEVKEMRSHYQQVAYSFDTDQHGA